MKILSNIITKPSNYEHFAMYCSRCHFRTYHALVLITYITFLLRGQDFVVLYDVQTYKKNPYLKSLLSNE